MAGRQHALVGKSAVAEGDRLAAVAEPDLHVVADPDQPPSSSPQHLRLLGHVMAAGPGLQLADDAVQVIGAVRHPVSDRPGIEAVDLVRPAGTPGVLPRGAGRASLLSWLVGIRSHRGLLSIRYAQNRHG